MTTRTWTASSGSFTNASNWDTGVPGPADSALFGAAVGTVTDGTTISGLTTANGGNWTWTGQIAAGGYSANGNDTLAAGARWTIIGTPSQGGYMGIGGGNGSIGNLLLQTGSSILSTQAADTGTYGIYVGSGGTGNGIGTLTLDGASMDMGKDGITVGQTGAGALTLRNGSTAHFATSNSSLIAAFAAGRGAKATIAIDKSTVTADGFVSIGRGGNATMTLTGASTFTGGATSAAPGGAASLNVGDSTPSTATNPGFGGSGTLEIDQGSMVHSLGGMNVGYDGTAGTVTIDGTGSQLNADGTVQIGGGLQRVGGNGTLTIRNGGTLRSGTPATGIASFAVGTGMPGDTGTVTVTGAGSLLDANGYRISIGTASTNNTQRTGATGSMTISAGGKVVSGASYSDSEAALALGSVGGGTGTLTITGTGSQLVANGQAVLGGNNSGTGIMQGGTATVTVIAGGLLQTGAMNIESGATLTVDAASKVTAPTITIDGGALDLGQLTTANAIAFGAGGKLTVHSVVGANSIANFSYGDAIDVAGGTVTSQTTGTITTATGSVTIGAAPAGTAFNIASDGAGGSIVSLSPQTIGVFRFFEATNGTHFYTTDPGEAKGLSDPSSPSYRPDLTQEVNDFGAFGAAPSDPNQVKVYRFFDAAHGTEFLTASKDEANGLITEGSSTYRADLKFESNSNFYEHGTQQTGDVAVYRYFDSILGTHFYTADAGERATISATRPDLISEGIGFYAPSTMPRAAS